MRKAFYIFCFCDEEKKKITNGEHCSRTAWNDKITIGHQNIKDQQIQHEIAHVINE